MKLVYRLMEEFPDQMLLNMFAARNEGEGTMNSGRVRAAKDLINKLSDVSFNQAQRVKQTAELVEAYIELADFSIKVPGQRPPDPGQQFDITPKLKAWMKARDSLVPVLTATASHHQSVLPLVKRFDEKAQYPGGVTCPKKITCFDTRDRPFTQLVKGEDPRPDAVASQLFDVMRMLLETDKQCRLRGLNISTYKVIPLSAKACVLEWVEDTEALGTILGRANDTWPSSLHARYDKKGWTARACSDRMRRETLQKTKFPQPDEAWKDIMENTKPVFRHFFLEQSSSALEWFRMRLAYTRSVAASSMAGYIVGLGDRHTSNILVRKDIQRCGELVHIDLGMVFDQGKLLSIPETVPFRLTRDMVDGMGVAGTEGVMTRCCEETLRVLRDNKQALLAIADVLLHDPLDSWRMTPEKAARQQESERKDGDTPMESEVAGANARLVRMKLKEKLEGWDRGELLGVQGQV
jgi:ataxia telangiectasia mutated family protein